MASATHVVRVKLDVVVKQGEEIIGRETETVEVPEPANVYITERDEFIRREAMSKSSYVPGPYDNYTMTATILPNKTETEAEADTESDMPKRVRKKGQRKTMKGRMMRHRQKKVPVPAPTPDIETTNDAASGNAALLAMFACMEARFGVRQ